MSIEQFLMWLIALFAFFTICLLGILLYFIYTYNKHKSCMENITEYSINVAANIDRSVPAVLECVIQDCFDDYKIKSMVINHGHINSKEEAKIREDIVAMVSSRISDATLDKISLFYDLNNIAAIIADKIYITVMHFVIDHNREIENIELQNSANNK